LLPYIKQEGTRIDAVQILDIVTAKGNAKEVFLKCAEALKVVEWDPSLAADDNEDHDTTGKLSVDEDILNDIALTHELFRATNEGSSHTRTILMAVYKRIRTERPARFLTTFSAALLVNLTNAFHVVVDSEHLHDLNVLMLGFIESCLTLADEQSSKNRDDLIAMLEGAITEYLPLYLSGSQMLFWSCRYWEESHPRPSNRIASKDLVSHSLEQDAANLWVHYFFKFLI
jgi:Uncharacterised protein family, YAP/Alf4/glomulin